MLKPLSKIHPQYHKITVISPQSSGSRLMMVSSVLKSMSVKPSDRTIPMTRTRGPKYYISAENDKTFENLLKIATIREYIEKVKATFYFWVVKCLLKLK